MAKTALCEAIGHRSTLKYQLDSLRLAAQLERHFSRRELFTILANRVYFGEGQYGVRAASLHYFDKEPNQLLVGEAALLAALLRSPTLYSPRMHPDKALERRNHVLDQLVSTQAITESEGSAAKAAPVSIVAANPWP